MDKVIQDLRFALRVYANNKTFTVIAVLALSIGIGSNIAVFSVVNALFLRPLPYPESERLVQIGRLRTDGPSYPLTYTRFRFYEQNNRTLDSFAAYDVVGSSLSVSTGDTPHLIQSSRVSANFFRVLGINPLLGRTFVSEDEQPNDAPLVVISHGTWSRLFGNDPDVVGRSVRMSGENYTIIGVMPADFKFGNDSEAWIPLRKSEDWSDRSNAYLAIGRLRPGISIDTAQQDFGLMFEKLRETQPASVSENEVRVLITSYQDRIIGDTRIPLLILGAVVACVLLIACSNVANLLFARAIGRSKEMALRVALGVNRFRLIRQLLTESLLLAFISGALGLFLAMSALSVLEFWLPLRLPKLAELNIDLPVVMFSLGTIGLTTIVFGLAPALQLTKMNPAHTLRALSGTTSSRGTRRLQAALVSLEIALSSALLLTAGLLLSSFDKLRNVELGYEPEGVVAIQTSLAGPEFTSTAQVTDRTQRVIERLKTNSEIQHVATVTRLPTESSLVLTFELLSPGLPTEELPANWKAVTPEFFDALRIQLQQGRKFTDHDGPDAAPVAMVNQTFVRKFLGNVNPIGARFVVGRTMGKNFADEPREIVGIVEDTRGSILEQTPAAAIFVPAAQVPDATTVFLNQIAPLSWVVQVKGDPSLVGSRIRKDVFSVDSSLVASNPRPLIELLSALTEQKKTHATLVSFFAGIALFLGAVGLHGVLARSVAERKLEIGIRMALGASRGRLLTSIVKYSLRLLVPGLAAGVILSLVMRQVLRNYLFGLDAIPITVYSTVILLLSVIAMVATIGPALRATKVNPASILRQ
ncbi:MAG TPA: ABC transporter permease [Pyrinomonadaceae bacterium]